MAARRGKPDLPPLMLSRFEEMGFDLSQFVPALLRPPSQTFRINTLKAEREQVLKSLSYLEPEPVGWNDLVFRVKGRLKLGNLLEHFLGLIYAQDSSSTIPVTVLDPQPDEEILDMAAAPGSKATQIAAAMANTGLLVANDVSPKRIPSLTANLDRSGVLNTVVTRLPGQAYGHIAAERFDRVLIDAPCSSEGTLSRSLKALEIWSKSAIKRLSATQRNLILSAYYCLKPGGVMVYSTCTFAPEENEGTVSHLLDKFPDAIVEPTDLEGLKTQPGFSEWRGEEFNPAVKNILRLFPHEHDGEGFCVARITKPKR
ncbi:tRNA methyltransferase [candidate division TA06 bacterium B3_TA06]|uniref:tRNA methyltransferase n=1 Tax=candidate division TA06 bacterium B3_TA06 TaxID=2012487 RepID=A0A532V8K4_UNCT6|nr:MAG: tRNA methyltransferase [candidate division TA06 bacterium B3_TA06]